MDFNTLQSNLLFRTPIYFEKDEIVKYQEVTDYLDIGVYNALPNGSKRKAFAIIIHGLKYLNPSEDADAFIRSYIAYVNNTRCNPRMEIKQMFRYVDFQFNYIKEYGCKPMFDHKVIHTNHNLKHTLVRRTEIGKKLSGMVRSNRYIEKIAAAKEELRREGKKVNKSNVAKKGISDKTVLKYWNAELHDVEFYVQQINEDYRSNKSAYYDEGYIGPETPELLPKSVNN